MTKTIEINMMIPPWINYAMGDFEAMGEQFTLKSQLRATLWEAGWKDGVEIKCISKPPFINYQWEIAE